MRSETPVNKMGRTSILLVSNTDTIKIMFAYFKLNRWEQRSDSKRINKFLPLQTKILLKTKMDNMAHGWSQNVACHSQPK